LTLRKINAENYLSQFYKFRLKPNRASVGRLEKKGLDMKKEISHKLKMRCVERGICPIAKST